MATDKLTPKQEIFAQEVAKGTNLKVGLTLSKHLVNLEKLRDSALQNNAFGAAVTAEVSRGKAAGLYIDRKEVLVNKVSTMSKDAIIRRIQQLHEESGGTLPILEGQSTEIMVGDRMVIDES